MSTIDTQTSAESSANVTFEKVVAGLEAAKVSPAPAMAQAAPGLSKPGAVSYKAADRFSAELGCWQPPLVSADKAMLPEKGTAEGRVRDLVRNNGYARGAVQNQKDRIVGSRYKLQLTPVAKQLGIDPNVAAEWASGVEIAFETWANDPDCWIDAQRKRTFTQILRECVATEMIQGEAFVVRQWRPSPSGFATCFQTVEPERISTPDQGQSIWSATGETIAPNGNRIRAGIEMDSFGAEVAVHIRTQHPNDVGLNLSAPAGKWDRITVLNQYGWRQVIHMFDPEQPDQTRGFGAMVSTLQKMKMGDMQEDLELQLNQLSTAFAMYVKSPLGRARAQEIMGSGDFNSFAGMCQELIQAQDAYYGDRGVSINGVKIPFLFPDDEIAVLQSHNQPANHEQFKEGLNRQNARGAGMSYEEWTGDFSKTNYSSGRLSMQLAWQYVLAKRISTVDKLATHIFRLWFDEAIVKGAITPPPGVEYWPDNSTAMGQKFAALTRCSWIGAGKVVVDENKQANANETKLSTYQTDLADVLAENGTDLESMLDTNVRVRQMFIERGLPLPPYLGGPPAAAKPADLSSLIETNNND